MRIKVLVNVVTIFGQYRQGEVDLSDPEAAVLLDRGWAIRIEETTAPPVSMGRVGRPPQIESGALAGPEETAAELAPRRKKAKPK